MTTPDVNPEEQKESAETTSKSMTFAKLREQLQGRCECIDDQPRLDDITKDGFARRIWGAELEDGDFLSYKEENKPDRYTECEEICQYHGVSITKTGDAIEEKLLLKYKTSLNLAPEGKQPYYCRFRFKDGAGVVQHTKSRPNPNHHTLYKSDGFCKGLIAITEIISLLD